MKGKTHYFYVLCCRDGSFYGGYTTDLERRVRQHNEGKGVKYTRARRPVRLLFSKGYPSKTEALKAEYRFKSLTRKEKEEFLLKELGETYAAAKKL